MLLVKLLDISPAMGGERVVTGGNVFENEAAVIAGRDGLTRIGDRLRLNKDLHMGERLAVQGIDDDAGDLKTLRGRGGR